MRGSREVKIGRAGARWSDGEESLAVLRVDVSFRLTCFRYRLIMLNGMKASEELTEEQARQVSPGVV